MDVGIGTEDSPVPKTKHNPRDQYGTKKASWDVKEGSSSFLVSLSGIMIKRKIIIL